MLIKIKSDLCAESVARREINHRPLDRNKEKIETVIQKKKIYKKVLADSSPKMFCIYTGFF